MSTRSPSPAPTRLGRVRRVLLRIAAALLVLVAAALAFVLRDLDGRVRRALLEGAAEASAILGRKVTLGEVHVALGRTSEIVVREVAVEAQEGATGELATAPLRIPEVRLAVEVGPLLRSWGERVEITRFAVDGAEVYLVRTPEGLSIDDVRARLATLPKRRPPKGTAWLREVSLRSAKVRLHELGAPAERDVVLSGVSLMGRDLRPGAASRLTLGAAVLAPEKNLDVDLDLGPSPSGGLALTHAEVRARAIRLMPFAAWARAGTAALDGAALDATVSVEPKEVASVKGSISLSGLALAPGAPSSVKLTTDAMIDATAGTLAVRSFEVEAGGVSAHGSLSMQGLAGAPAIESVEVEARGEMDAIRAVIPADRWPPAIDARGPVTLRLRGAGNADEVRGDVKIEVAEVRAVDARGPARAEGRSVKLGAGVEIAYARAARSLRIAKAEIDVGSIALRGEAEVRGLGEAPAIEALTVDARGEAESILELVPPSRRPAGLGARGPVHVEIHGRGKAGEVQGTIAIDLDRAAIAARGVTKPAGVPLGATIEGSLAGGRARVEHGAVRVGPLSVTGSANIASATDLKVTFATARPAEIAGLMAIAPDLAERIGGRAALDGRLGASGEVRRSGNKIGLEIEARLRDARVRRAGLALGGAVSAKAKAELVGEDGNVEAAIDLDGASIDVAPAIAKRVGQPARASFTITRDGDRVRVREARASLPGITLEGIAVERDPEKVRVTIGAATIALADLAEAVPLLRGALPPPIADATLRCGVELDTSASNPAAGTLRLPSFEISGGIGRMQGAIEVDGLRPARVVRVEVRGGELDLTGFARGGGEALVPEGGPRVEARVHLGTIKLPGETATDLDADVTSERGRLSVSALRVRALGGSIDLAKSSVDLADVPEIELHGRFEGIDLARVPQGSVDELRGRASGAVDLQGRGLDGAAIARSLTGTVRLDVRDLHGKPHFEPKVSIVNPILGKLAQRAAEKRKGKKKVEIDLREASAALAIEGGVARTRTPITLRSEDFTATLSGALGEGRSLALSGQVEIFPRVFQKATNGILIPLHNIPLALKIFDDGTGRKLELLDLGETVAAMRGALRAPWDDGAIAP